MDFLRVLGVEFFFGDIGLLRRHGASPRLLLRRQGQILKTAGTGTLVDGLLFLFLAHTLLADDFF